MEDNSMIGVDYGPYDHLGGPGRQISKEKLGDEERELLNYFLINRGETQATFCKRNGINNSVFSLWKNGNVKPGLATYQIAMIIEALRRFKESVLNGSYQQMLQQHKTDVKDELKENQLKESTEQSPKKRRPEREKHQNSLFEEYDCSMDWHSHKKHFESNSEDEIRDDSSSSSEQTPQQSVDQTPTFMESVPSQSDTGTSLLYNKQNGPILSFNTSPVLSNKNTSNWFSQQQPWFKAPNYSSSLVPGVSKKRPWSESNTPAYQTTNQNADLIAVYEEDQNKKQQGASSPSNETAKINPISVLPFLIKPEALPWDKQCIFCDQPRKQPLCCDNLRCHSKIGASLFPHGLGVTERNSGLCMFAYKEFYAGQTVVPGYWGNIMTGEQVLQLPDQYRASIHKFGHNLYIDGKPKSKSDVKDMIETGQIGSLLQASMEESITNTTLIRTDNHIPVIKATRFIAVGQEIVLQIETIDIPHKSPETETQQEIVTSKTETQQDKHEELAKEIRGMVEVLQSIQANLDGTEPDYENIARMLRPAIRTTEKSFQLARKLSGVEV